MRKIGLHSKMNRLPINFEDEIILNCFLGIIKKFNNRYEDDLITLSYQEIWEIAGFKNRCREKELITLLTQLTKSSTYKVKDGSILNGSVFVTKRIPEKEEVVIEIPKLFKPYIFTGRDMHLMSKAKKKEKMEIQELDYWDRELKEKKKNLVLLEEAEAFGIRGKYAKRLYMLLKQFADTGYFVMGIEEFREVMEIPEAYSLGKMNAEIINKAKAELNKKEIFEFPEEPKGKGRRKIEKIEISFSELKKEKPKTKAEKTQTPTEDTNYAEAGTKGARAILDMLKKNKKV